LCNRQSSFHRFVVVFVVVAVAVAVVAAAVAAAACDDDNSDIFGCYVYGSRRFEVTRAFVFMYP